MDRRAFPVHPPDRFLPVTDHASVFIRFDRFTAPRGGGFSGHGVVPPLFRGIVPSFRRRGKRVSQKAAAREEERLRLFSFFFKSGGSGEIDESMYTDERARVRVVGFKGSGMCLIPPVGGCCLVFHPRQV